MFMCVITSAQFIVYSKVCGPGRLSRTCDVLVLIVRTRLADRARGIVVSCYFSKEDSRQCDLACLHDDGLKSTKNLGSSSSSLRGIKPLWL